MRYTRFEPLPFSACLAMADCAARCFAEWRTSNKPGPDLAFSRQFLREPPVEVLRYLWKTGDAYQRQIVAARVYVWMKKEAEAEKVAAFSQTILARELARAEEPERKAA